MPRILCLAPLLLTACQHTPAPYPTASDVNALAVPRPKMPPEALTDPTADAEYRSVLRKWEDDLSGAGLRVCRFFKRQGMEVGC